MSGHPAVEFLTAALARAEETAKAATPGPWRAHRYDWDGDGFEASIGHHEEADVVGHGYEGGGVVEWADAQFIEAFSPDVVLRLVAGAREVLAEHASDGDARWPECVRCADDGLEVDYGDSGSMLARSALAWPPGRCCCSRRRGAGRRRREV